jgi:hypothetical protein
MEIVHHALRLEDVRERMFALETDRVSYERGEE